MQRSSPQQTVYAQTRSETALLFFVIISGKKSEKM